MPVFTGRHTNTHVLARSPAEAAGLFADLGNWVTCHPDLAGADRVDAQTLAVRLKPMSHGPVSFSGHYTMHFTRVGDTVRWQTGKDGNMDVSGEARFEPSGSGSRLVFTESISMDMDLNRLVAVVIRPVAETMMTHGMQRFAERMVALIDGTSR